MKKFKRSIAMMLVFTMIVSLFNTSYLVKAETSNTFKVGTMSVSASENPDLNQHLSWFIDKQLDVVGIQGLDNNTSRNPYNMLDALKGEAYPYTSFQKAFDFAGGAYGNGMISNIAMKNTSGSPFTTVSNEEPRAWQRITIEVNGKDVSVYNVFLAWESKEINLAQIRELISIMNVDTTEHKVLVGNFNVKQFRDNMNEFTSNYTLAHGKDDEWIGDYRYNIITTKNIKISDVEESSEEINGYKLFSATCELFDEEVDENQNLDLVNVGTMSVSASENPDLSQHLNWFINNQLDVVGIQGLDNNTSRNPYNMLDALKGEAYPYTSYQKSFDFAGGTYGNGMISNREIKGSDGSPFTTISNEEPRAWQRITIEVNGKDVSVYNVFLAWESKEINLAQIRELIAIMNADTTAYKVLVGNFNVKQFRDNMNEFASNYRLANGNNDNWITDYRYNVITTKNIKIIDAAESPEEINGYKLFYATCELFDEEVEDEPVDTPVDVNPNLALFKDVTCSSQEVDYTFFDYWAVDGDATTRWSPGYSTEEWIQVDLGEVKEISEIFLNLYAEGPEYKVLISTDGSEYETVLYVTDGSNTNNVQKTITFDTPKQARYVKYLQMQPRLPDSDGMRWPTSVSELEVYAKIREVDVPTKDSVIIGSFNISSGENPDINAMIEVLEENGIDYVGVQEVDKYTSRNNKDVLATFSGTGTYPYTSFQPAMDFAGGQYGIGIISKTEIKDTSGGNLEVRANDEPRAWQRVLVEVDGKEIAFYNTHLSFESEAATNNQIEDLIAIMNEDTTEYKVITGDFNICYNKEQIYPFLVDYNITNGKDGVWFDTFNGPSTSANIAIDNIITTRNMKLKDVQVVDTSDLSDHNMFFAEFELLDETIVSTEYLDILKEKAEALDAASYTEETYGALETAMSKASALTDVATQAEINAVVIELNDALNGLVEKFANPNLALNKPVSVSSQEVDYTFFDYWAVDGDTTTRWSPGYAMEEWLQVDLGGVKEIEEIYLDLYAEGPEYKVLISTDGVEYETVLYVTDGSSANNVKKTITFDTPKQARYVKYLQMQSRLPDGDGNRWPTSISELEVYRYKNTRTDTAQGNLDTIETIAPTISEDGTKVVLPKLENDAYEVSIYGSSNKAVIGLDGTIYQPLEDMDVTLLYKVTNVEDESDMAISDNEVEITIPGTFSQEANDNARPEVVPGIREWKGNTGEFTFASNAKIVVCDASLMDLGAQVAYYLDEMLGKELAVTTGEPQAGDIYLALANKEELGKEGYYIEIGDVIYAEAYTETGLLYAGTTLTQMFYQDEGHDQVSKGIIRDYPQYETRSVMIDVARFFMPIDYLEEITKYMAYYKFNEIHVHINDDEGEPDYNGAAYNSAFRLESKKYPEINQGGEYYTQDEYRSYQKEVAKYGVKVVTEIDTPAHSGFARFYDPELMLEGYYMDVRKPEVLAFTKSLLDEFLDGDDPVIQSDEFHIGTDEYFVSVDTGDAFAVYMDELMDYVNQKGYKTRFWSNNHINGYDLDATNTTVDMWAHGIYGDYDYFISNGFKLINLDMYKLYCVPGFDYGSVFTDYYDVEYLYDTFEVKVLSDGTEISLANPQLLGGSIALWNDYKEGFSQFDIFDRLRDGIVLTAEKNWYGVNDEGSTGEDFVARVAKVDNGTAPGANPARYVASNDEVVASYDFDNISEGIAQDATNNGYNAVMNGLETVTIDGDSFVALNGQASIKLPFKSIGYPYTVEFDLYIDESTPENAVLFNGLDGTLYLNYDGTGKIGFERKGYRYIIDCEYELNTWQHITITCDESETKLSINGKLATAQYYETEARRLKSSTFILPVEEIGTGVVGYLDNLVIDDEVQVMSSENLAYGKDVTSSSHEVDYTFFDYWVVDGDLDTRWSPGFSDEEWIEVDLGEVKELGQINLYFFQEAPEYKVLVSEDGDTYEEVLHVTDGCCDVADKEIELDGVKARYVKYLQMAQCWIESDQAYYGSSLYEVEVYEKQATDETESIDTTVLKDAIATAEAIDVSTYTEESVNALFETIEEGKITLIRKDLTQAMVNAMAEAIEAAKEALQTKSAKVTGLVASVENYKTVSLSWDVAYGAEAYVIERLNTTTNEWMVVGTTTETSYVVAGVKTGKEYTYRVKATRTVDGETVEEEASDEVKATAMLSGEVELTLTNNGSNTFDLTWTKVDGATRYVIYRKAEGGAWQKILTLGKDATSYTTRNMATGTYYYQVKAARYDSVDRVMTDGSNVVVGIAGDVTPELAISETNGTSITLTWDKVVGMDYYEVYRSKDGGAYRQIKRTTSTSTISSSLKTGSTYTYKVRGCKAFGEQKVYGNFSNEVTYTVE